MRFTFYGKKWMIEEIKCPRCQSEAVVPGRYLDQLAGGLGQNFRIKELRQFAFGSTDVSISSDFHACTECGLLWNEIDTVRLKKVIRKNRTKQVKKRTGIEA